jgi:hypothetical protein
MAKSSKKTPQKQATTTGKSPKRTLKIRELTEDEIGQVSGGDDTKNRAAYQNKS